MSGLVLVGEIVGAFGVRGEVRVRSHTETPHAITGYGPLLNAEGEIVLTPKSWRSLNQGIAITAPEVPTREAAEALRRTELYVPRERLPLPAADEFYHVDLVGCRVEDEAGVGLGEVVEVLDYGGGQILAIAAPDGGQILHPFTLDAVPTVDLPNRRIVIRPLLDETD